MQAERPAGSGGPAIAVSGVETEEAQDAQVVLGDPPRRITNEAHAPLREVVEPANMIMHRAVARDVQRIHREVAPLGVAPPVTPECDPGMASEGLDVLAQRRHLERLAVDHDGDGAMLDAGRNRLETGGLARRITSSGTAVVAISISPTGSPSNSLRTAPPTTRASSPSRSSTSSSRGNGPLRSQGGSMMAGRAHAAAALLCLSRHEFAVLDMRRNVG